VLAEDGETDNLTVCLDSAFAGISFDSESLGEKLFDNEGNESDYLKGLIEFMRRYRREMLRCSELAAQLAQAGLLVARSIDVRLPDNGVQKLNGLLMVDEEKLAQLGAEETAALHASGALSLAYAHLVSVNNLGRLGALLTPRLAVEVASTQTSSKVPELPTT
jgi:hypothetical protein